MRGNGVHSDVPESPRAQPNPACFVCGAENARGLQLEFRADGARAVVAEWVPSPDWEGFRGIVHGGVVSTVLDEAMSKAVTASRIEALTAELRVRFRRAVIPMEPLRIRGWIRGRRKRVIETEAAIVAGDGVELAHAWATFLELRGNGGSSDPAGEAEVQSGAPA